MVASARWLLALVGSVIAAATPIHGAAGQHAHDHAGEQATAPMAGMSTDADAPMLHMRMTDARPRAAGDSARLARLTDAVRAGIARYVDVRAAERAGYRPIFVGDTSVGQVLHYTHWMNGVWERWRLDPARPGSLLYEKQRDGSLRLVGAMYSAPDRSSLADLDARVPLAYARWHLHTDLCVPKPIWDKAAWARQLTDGRPAFGPESPVHTRADCESEGGAFHPHIFGWMIHAMVVDHAALTDVWSGGHEPAMVPTSGSATATGAPR